MGISPFALEKLLSHRLAGDLTGAKSVLQLGRQTTHNHALMNRLLLDAKIIGQEINIDDIALFKCLGMEVVDSIDTSAYEGASIIHDLNHQIPQKYYGAYDFIYDGGTLEHIFNTFEVLKNIHRMLRVNGFVIHASPANNQLDHGFFQFSPTFFLDYYTANGWKIIDIRLHRFTKNHAIDPWEWFSYEPGSLDQVSFGGLDNFIYGNWVFAVKTPNSTSDIMPQQGSYRRLKDWEGK